MIEVPIGLTEEEAISISQSQAAGLERYFKLDGRGWFNALIATGSWSDLERKEQRVLVGDALAYYRMGSGQQLDRLPVEAFILLLNISPGVYTGFPMYHPEDIREFLEKYKVGSSSNLMYTAHALVYFQRRDVIVGIDLPG